MSRRPYLQWTDPAAAEALAMLAVDEPEQWQQSALCAEVDGEIFFPEKGASTKDAKQVCLQCPVRRECLEYALETDQRFGIWGGLSERQRRGLKRVA